MPGHNWYIVLLYVTGSCQEIWNIFVYTYLYTRFCFSFNIPSTCQSGRWQCTENACPKTCSILGFQHIQTFDGQDYDNLGPSCSGDRADSGYTLVEVRTKSTNIYLQQFCIHYLV